MCVFVYNVASACFSSLLLSLLSCWLNGTAAKLSIVRSYDMAGDAKCREKYQKPKAKSEEKKMWGHQQSGRCGKRNYLDFIRTHQISIAACFLFVSLPLSMPDIVNIFRHLNAKDSLHNGSRFAVYVCVCDIVESKWLKEAPTAAATNLRLTEIEYWNLIATNQLFCTWWLAIVTHLMIIPLSVGTNNQIKYDWCWCCCRWWWAHGWRWWWWWCCYRIR